MVERFLRYSLDHNRPIKVLMADTLKFRNITVIALEGNKVSFLTARKKNPETVALSAFLSASYARGDDGDTLKYGEAFPEGEKHAGKSEKTAAE